MVGSKLMHTFLNLLFWPMLLNDKSALIYAASFLMYGAMIIVPLAMALSGLLLINRSNRRQLGIQLIGVSLCLGVVSLLGTSINNVSTIIYSFLGPGLVIWAILSRSKIDKIVFRLAIITGALSVYLLTLSTLAASL
jgi:hypothetical protein